MVQGRVERTRQQHRTGLARAPPLGCDGPAGPPYEVMRMIQSPPPPPPQHTHGPNAGWLSQCKYTADLLTLDFCRPAPCQEHRVTELMEVTTPLRHEAWAEALATHPDQALARYIVTGLREGFRIGFQRGFPLRSARENLQSAALHPRVISDYLHKECRLGRMLGPYDDIEHLPPLQISRFGVIPKGHGTGEWRLITDLSAPHGASVNDGIDPEFTSLQYLRVDEVAARVTHVGVLPRWTLRLPIARSLSTHRTGHCRRYGGRTRCTSTFRTQIRPENIQCRGRCPPVDTPSGRHPICPTLPR